MSKPDWKDAPNWAEWLAMDDYGLWYWHEEKPEYDGGEWNNGGFTMLASECIDSSETLESRHE